MSNLYSNNFKMHSLECERLAGACRHPYGPRGLRRGESDVAFPSYLGISVIIALSMLLYSSFTFAKEDENKPPTECKIAGFQFKLKTLVLTPDQVRQEQALYLFHNIGTQPLHLYQMRDEESARSIYLNHTIDPNRWAVLATSEKQSRYLCAHTQAKSDRDKVVSCTDYLQVCQFVHTRFGMNNKGNYWMVSNTDRNSAYRGIVHYGIIP